jgi:hypothetical protein
MINTFPSLLREPVSIMAKLIEKKIKGVIVTKSKLIKMSPNGARFSAGLPIITPSRVPAIIAHIKANGSQYVLNIEELIIHHTF